VRGECQIAVLAFHIENERIALAPQILPGAFRLPQATVESAHRLVGRCVDAVLRNPRP
jgi:hypothetical protein